MADIYGSWLDEDFDYADTHKKLESLHPHFYPKYVERIEAINLLADLFVDEYSERYPSLKPYFKVSYQNILAMVGRYFNDIIHYKVWHQIDVSEKGKMVAHLVKWAFIYPPVQIPLDRSIYESLKPDIRELVFNISELFIAHLIVYIVEGFASGNVDMKKINKIFYLLETNQYDAKTATLMFKEIL